MWLEGETKLRNVATLRIVADPGQSYIPKGGNVPYPESIESHEKIVRNNVTRLCAGCRNISVAWWEVSIEWMSEQRQRSLCDPNRDETMSSWSRKLTMGMVRRQNKREMKWVTVTPRALF